MPRPLPGVDPYIESQGRWPDFHASLLLYIRDHFSARLPQSYVAQLEEHVYLVEAFSDDERLVRPDIAIARDDMGEGHGSGGGMATSVLAPVAVELATEMVEDERARWIEIRRLPDMRLVTLIELLSPSNKTGIGRERYLEKRLSFIASPIHLVELDLLSGGQRLPMRRPYLPKGDYYALVSRAENRPMADVYAWTVRDTLPTIPIPLLSPDPDVPLDLAPLYDLAYQNGRYGHVLKYDRPVEVPLDDGAREWVKTTVSTSTTS